MRYNKMLMLGLTGELINRVGRQTPVGIDQTAIDTQCCSVIACPFTRELFVDQDLEACVDRTFEPNRIRNRCQSAACIPQREVGTLLIWISNPPTIKACASSLSSSQVMYEKRSTKLCVREFTLLLDELSAGDVIRKQSLLQDRSLLQKHLDDYLKAVEVTRQTDRDETLATLYERFLDAAKSLPEANHEGIYDSFTVLGKNFSGYVEVRKKRGDKQRITELIETFAPHWDHNLGYGTIGNAAFDAEQWDLAERYFLKLKKGMDSYVRCEEMSRLASIWHACGETKQAKDLIIECMAGTLKQIRESKYNSDRDMFAGEYSSRKKTIPTLPALKPHRTGRSEARCTFQDRL